MGGYVMWIPDTTLRLLAFLPKLKAMFSWSSKFMFLLASNTTYALSCYRILRWQCKSSTQFLQPIALDANSDTTAKDGKATSFKVSKVSQTKIRVESQQVFITLTLSFLFLYVHLPRKGKAKDVISLKCPDRWQEFLLLIFVMSEYECILFFWNSLKMGKKLLPKWTVDSTNGHPSSV